jgi:gamma-glutamylcyclotransferase (GGCT)/AIG2-like uncharacterized protein YtfP
MCLVCFINAEETRSKKSGSYSATTSSSASETSSDDGSDSENQPRVPHAIHYFAIGSMTNSTALALRELTPISSQPATLQGYRLLFRGSGGMATAEKEGHYEHAESDAGDYPFDCIHGVLHLLSGPQMKVLDEIEGGYKRRTCKVLLYDGKTEVNAYVYQMNLPPWKPTLTSLQEGGVSAPPAKTKHELPTERYLDIIAQGCGSHGVDPKWVEFIRSHQCIPRKCASQFASFSASMTDAIVPIIPWEQVRVNNGRNGAKLWIVINNKVLEFKGDVTSFFPFGYFVKHKIGGTDFTVKFAKGFFEPKYIHGYSSSGASGGSAGAHFNFSRVTSSSQLGNEHRAWVEDQFAAPPPVLASSKWALVGVVDVSLPVSDPVALTRNSTFGMRRTKVIAGRSAGGSGLPSADPSVPSTPTRRGRGGSDGIASSAHSRVPSEVSAAVAATDVLDLTADINEGFNHFFISGTTSTTWIVPDGIHPGQTLYVRKTATDNYQTPVNIRIRNQNLGGPNVRADTYSMPPNVYYLSWCWDGDCWFLEQVGRAEL